MVDVIPVVLAAAVGSLATLAVLRLTTTQQGQDPPARKDQLTTAWRLSELKDPVLVAKDVRGVEVPAGTTVLASGLVDAGIQAACEVREVPPVRAEFALDLAQERALVFLGGVQPDSLAWLTVDEALYRRLHTEYKRLLDRAGEYVERFRIPELAGRHGVTVETEGFVQDILPWKGRFLLRLEEGGHTIGVAVDKDPEALRERKVRVKGRLEKDETGYAVVQAQELRTIG